MIHWVINVCNSSMLLYCFFLNAVSCLQDVVTNWHSRTFLFFILYFNRQAKFTLFFTFFRSLFLSLFLLGFLANAKRLFTAITSALNSQKTHNNNCNHYLRMLHSNNIKQEKWNRPTRTNLSNKQFLTGTSKNNA